MILVSSDKPYLTNKQRNSQLISCHANHRIVCLFSNNHQLSYLCYLRFSYIYTECLTNQELEEPPLATAPPLLLHQSPLLLLQPPLLLLQPPLLPLQPVVIILNATTVDSRDSMATSRTSVLAFATTAISQPYPALHASENATLLRQTTMTSTRSTSEFLLATCTKHPLSVLLRP